MRPPRFPSERESLGIPPTVSPRITDAPYETKFTRERSRFGMYMKLLGIVGLAAAGLLAATLVTSVSTHAGPSPGCTVDASIDSEEQAFLQIINQYRQQNNRAPLKLSATLNKAAAWKSRDMANNNYVAHDDTPSGRTWVDRFRDCGYTYNAWLGENIAVSNSLASLTFEQWRGSSGHNANMLGTNYTAIGIGRAYNANSNHGWYWTTEFGSYSDGYSAPTPPSTATPRPPTATPRPPTPTPGSSQPPGSQPCGDVSNNGSVGVEDILLVVTSYMTPNPTADFDNNGTVGMPDILLVVHQYGTDC